MHRRLEIKIGGMGGQGVVYAATLIGVALSYRRGYVAVSAQYGPESRGSLTTADAVFSTHPIDYPYTEGIDILIAFHQEAYTALVSKTRKGGLIIVDSDLVTDIKGKAIKLPASTLAQKEVGNFLMANLILVGGLIKSSRIITPHQAFKALKEISAATAFDLNLKALRLGLDYKS